MRRLLDDVVAALVAAVVAHQLVTLFLAIAVEEAGVPLPVPGDLLIAFYGWRAQGDALALALVILVCALASTAGTQVPYWIARRFGPRVLGRVAYWLDIDPRDIDRLFDRIDRHGFAAVFVARLIPGLRVAVSLVAGTARVPPAAFAGGVFAAAAVYWTGWVLLGAFLGPRVVDAVSPAYLKVIVIAVPAAIVVSFALRVLVARRRRRLTSGGTRGGRA